MKATQTGGHLYCYITALVLKEPKSCATPSTVDSDLGYPTCAFISNKSRDDAVDSKNYLMMYSFLKHFYSLCGMS